MAAGRIPVKSAVYLGPSPPAADLVDLVNYLDYQTSRRRRDQAIAPPQLPHLGVTMLPTARRVLATRASGLIGRAPALTLSAYARQRLLSTLAILEQRDGQLNHSSLSAFTAAKKLGGTVHGFIAGSNIKAVAEEAAKVDGVEKIIVVDNGAYDKVRIITASPAIAAINAY